MCPLQQESEAFINEPQFTDAIFEMERTILDGGQIDPETLSSIPDALLLTSPLLLQQQGWHCYRRGRLNEAVSYFKDAVQGFASQTFQARLLDALSQLTLVCLRIGEWQDARTILAFLKTEAMYNSSSVGGNGMYALACGAFITDDMPKQSEWYRLSQSLYLEAGDAFGYAEAGLASLLDSGDRMDESVREQLLLRIDQKAALSSGLQPYGQLARGLACSQACQWNEASAIYSSIDAELLPYPWSVICRLKRLESALLASSPGASEDWELVNEIAEHCRPDIAIQIQIAGLRYVSAKLDHHENEAKHWQQALKSRLELSRNPVHTAWVLRWEETVCVCSPPNHSSSLAPSGSGWLISCFGKLRFSKSGTELPSMKWKRKKAMVLLVYLLTQPHFSAPKERVMVALLPDVSADRMNNHMYVMIHQLKQTLKQELNMEDVIQNQDGVLRLDTKWIQDVDVVAYLNLVRAGDQAWGSDRELAAEQYVRARRLYGEFVPELQSSDWLDQYRDYLADTQSGIVRRLAVHYAQRGLNDLAESCCREGIELRPLAEEGYAEMIRLLTAAGRTLEARGWYAKWERLCRDELGSQPLPETKQVLLENAAFAGKEASSSDGRSPEDKKLPHNKTPLLIQSRHSRSSLVLELRGDVTAEAGADLLTYRDERTRLRGGTKTLIINFQKAGYVDSGGLSALVRLARAVTDDGSRVFAYGLQQSSEALFRLVGMTRYMMIYPDEYAIEQRLSSLGSPHAEPKAARITF